MLPKKLRGFKKLRTNNQKNKSKAKTDDSEDRSFKRKLRTKALGLRITLDISSPPITPEVNCEEKERGLLDADQLEKIQMDDEKLNQLANYSANSFAFLQMPQFGLSSTGAKEPFNSPLLSVHITEIPPFYSQFDSYDAFFQKIPEDFK
jgi:hypothetical protein